MLRHMDEQPENAIQKPPRKHSRKRSRTQKTFEKISRSIAAKIWQQPPPGRGDSKTDSNFTHRDRYAFECQALRCCVEIAITA